MFFVGAWLLICSFPWTVICLMLRWGIIVCSIWCLIVMLSMCMYAGTGIIVLSYCFKSWDGDDDDDCEHESVQWKKKVMEGLISITKWTKEITTFRKMLMFYPHSFGHLNHRIRPQQIWNTDKRLDSFVLIQFKVVSDAWVDCLPPFGHLNFCLRP